MIEDNNTIQWAIVALRVSQRNHTVILLTWVDVLSIDCNVLYSMLDINTSHQARSLVNETLNYIVDFHWKAYFKYSWWVHSSSRFSTPPIHSKIFYESTTQCQFKFLVREMTIASSVVGSTAEITIYPSHVRRESGGMITIDLCQQTYTRSSGADITFLFPLADIYEKCWHLNLFL